MKGAAWVLFGVLVAWALAAVVLGVVGRLAEPAAEADVIVVAGCGVDEGGVASLCLRARTGAAVTLFEQGRAPLLLLTGGVGKHPPAEAVVAAELAREAGVPDQALVLETTSTSTEENAAQGLALVSARRVIVVSDYTHLWRLRRCFAAHGVVVSGQGVPGPLVDQVRGGLREVLAVGWYAATGRCAQKRAPNAPPA